MNDYDLRTFILEHPLINIKGLADMLDHDQANFRNWIYGNRGLPSYVHVALEELLADYGCGVTKEKKDHNRPLTPKYLEDNGYKLTENRHYVRVSDDGDTEIGLYYKGESTWYVYINGTVVLDAKVETVGQFLTLIKIFTK